MLVSDRPEKKARRKGTRAKVAARPLWLTYLAARPATTIAGATFAALVFGIVINALYLQKGRHPSPLFGGKARIVATLPLANAPIPMPAPRPADVTAAIAPPALPVASHAADAVEAKPKDQIGSLLRGANAPAQNANQTEVSKSVLHAQRALAKLGYGVKPDGVPGLATKQAVERFERDRKLPVHGELTPKVLRELTAQSGVPAQ